MIHRRARAGGVEDRVHSVIRSLAVEADQLVEGRQRRRQLYTLAHDATHLRKEWGGAAGVTRVAQLISGFEREYARVDLPAGGGMRFRWVTEHRRERCYPSFELGVGPRFIRSGNPILPAHMVVRVKTDFESGVAYRAHHRSCVLADVRPRQQRAVQERSQPVVLQYRGAPYFAKKSASKDASQGSPRV